MFEWLAGRCREWRNRAAYGSERRVADPPTRSERAGSSATFCETRPELFPKAATISWRPLGESYDNETGDGDSSAVPFPRSRHDATTSIYELFARAYGMLTGRPGNPTCNLKTPGCEVAGGNAKLRMYKSSFVSPSLPNSTAVTC